MPFAEWRDEFGMGVDELDADHKRLLALLNDLNDAMAAGGSAEELGRVLAALNLYMSFHFAHEEELLFSTRYSGAEAHHREHQVFASAVDEIFSDFQKRSIEALPREVLIYLKNWLYEHSIGADHEFAEFLKSHPDAVERKAS
jgi:hemerythrin